MTSQSPNPADLNWGHGGTWSAVPTFARVPVWNHDKGADIVILGVPFDGLASLEPGARFGPKAIRDASSRMRPYDPVLDVDIGQSKRIFDAGDVDTLVGYADLSMDRIRDAVAAIVSSGSVPVVLGGDHSISLAELRGIHGVRGPVALIHFDAHLDTYARPDPASDRRYGHSSPFRKAALEGLLLPDRSLQVGLRGNWQTPDALHHSLDLGFAVLPDHRMREAGVAGVVRQIRERVGDIPVFVSLDIDFVDPAFAPGTGSPEVGGPSANEVLDMLAGIRGMNIVGFDLVEVLPAMDPAGVTSLLAAQLTSRALALITAGT